MLTIMAELEYEGVKVISVADGIDSGDEEASLSIQIRGIFNEIQLQDAEHLRYVLQQVEKEIGKLRSTLPEDMKLKEAELCAQQRRLDNFIESIAEGRDSKALGKALLDAERQVESLEAEVTRLQESRERTFKVPPVEWIKERLLGLQEVLEGRTEKSALLLRELLGPICLEPVAGEAEKPFCRARTAIDTLALVETPLAAASAEGGSTGLRQWRRPELNRRPWP